jgi:hypothetical protein
MTGSLELLPHQIASKIVRAPSGCWIWTACQDTKGYGLVRYQQKTRRVHRLVFELIGPQPLDPALQLDHLCRRKACANPLHLAQVTSVENTRRRIELAHLQLDQCRHGHAFTPENTCHYRGERRCRECDREGKRKARRQKRMIA